MKDLLTHGMVFLYSARSGLVLSAQVHSYVSDCYGASKVSICQSAARANQSRGKTYHIANVVSNVVAATQRAA